MYPTLYLKIHGDGIPSAKFDDRVANYLTIYGITRVANYPIY